MGTTTSNERLLQLSKFRSSRCHGRVQHPVSSITVVGTWGNGHCHEHHKRLRCIYGHQLTATLSIVVHPPTTSRFEPCFNNDGGCSIANAIELLFQTDDDALTTDPPSLLSARRAVGTCVMYYWYPNM